MNFMLCELWVVGDKGEKWLYSTFINSLLHTITRSLFRVKSHSLVVLIMLIFLFLFFFLVWFLWVFFLSVSFVSFKEIESKDVTSYSLFGSLFYKNLRVATYQWLVEFLRESLTWLRLCFNILTVSMPTKYTGILHRNISFQKYYGYTVQPRLFMQLNNWFQWFGYVMVMIIQKLLVEDMPWAGIVLNMCL